MRILTAGASGLIGSELIRQLREGGHRVTRLVRRAPSGPDEVRWQPETGDLPDRTLDGVDAVISLSGASVGRIPWTPAYRRTLLKSRVVPTRALAEAMTAAANPPEVFLSASAVGFYGDRPGEVLTEKSSPGRGFFPELVSEWEATARLAPAATRVVTARSAVVVARGGGFGPVRMLTSLGLGTRFGTGQQSWPWISLHDEAAALRHLLASSLNGAVNLVGPTPATSDEITATYARLLRRPYVFRAPAPLVRLLGEAGQRLLLDSMDVRPERLRDDGFEWRHPRVGDAIAAALAAR